MFRIAICDDEAMARDQLDGATKRILRAQGIPHTTALFEDGRALLKAVDAGAEFDLLLLDILMDQMDGMSLAAHLKERQCRAAVVLVSSSADYALRGYEVDAQRYLTKPLDEDRLREALLSIHASALKRNLTIRQSGCCYQLPFDEILWVELRARFAMIVLKDADVPTQMRFAELQTLLPETFARCHQSFIVNLRHVRSIRRYEAVLSDGRRVPISKRYYLETRNRLLRYLTDRGAAPG